MSALTQFETIESAFTAGELVGTLVVPCERISEVFAIIPTPALARTGFTPLFLGGFTVTHVPTGLAVTPGSLCITCARRAAGSLVDLGLDWPADLTKDAAGPWRDALSEDKQLALKEITNARDECASSNCWWGDDE